MQAVLAIAIGILAGSGVYLLLRPRSFQVIMGLTLLSYAVNLFIFSMGRHKVDSEPILVPGAFTQRSSARATSSPTRPETTVSTDFRRRCRSSSVSIKPAVSSGTRIGAATR